MLLYILAKKESAALVFTENYAPTPRFSKVNGEEMELITGEKDLAAGTQALAEYGAKLVIVTLGADGAFFRYREYTAGIPAITVNIKVVDTNGAGDAFFGGLLYFLTRSESPLEQSEAEITSAVRFANAVGALTTANYGAIPAMPTLEIVKNALSENEKNLCVLGQGTRS